MLRTLPLLARRGSTRKGSTALRSAQDDTKRVAEDVDPYKMYHGSSTSAVGEDIILPHGRNFYFSIASSAVWAADIIPILPLS